MDNEYCSLEPQFPKEGYIAILFVFRDEEAVGILPLASVFTTTDEAADAVEKQLEGFESETIAIPHECVLIPVTFHSLYPLQRTFWENPTVHYDSFNRVTLFMSAVEHPEFYYLLVTPYLITDERTYLDATLPIKDPKDARLIEQFMLSSDQIVDEKAKSAAIYAMGPQMQFNWVTREIEEIIDETDFLEVN